MNSLPQHFLENFNLRQKYKSFICSKTKEKTFYRNHTATNLERRAGVIISRRARAFHRFTYS